MNMIASVARFDEAALEALFVDNKAPTWGDIDEAKKQLPVIMESFADILEDMPVRRDRYVREQLAFKYLERFMLSAGWTFCGAGYYSATFFKAGLVIKLGFKAEDSALLYAAWCRANQGRPGVPVIHAMKSEGLGFGIVMDRLEPIAGELTLGSSTFDENLYAEFSSVQDTINNGVDGWGQHMDLCRTAIDIREFFGGIANYDVHPANVMLDRNGEIVITDPVSFVGDTLSDEGTGE